MSDYKGAPIAVITVITLGFLALIGAGTFLTVIIINHFAG